MLNTKQNDWTDRRTADNSTYKKLAVQWLNEALSFVSSSVVADSLVLRNRQLLVAANAGKNAGSYNLGQICDIFDYCYKTWKYVIDTKGNEIVEYGSNTITNGLNGDCDDFAVLICSMSLSIGGEARINYAYGQNGGRAFTELNIGKTDIEVHISKRYKNVYDNSGIWTRTDNQRNNWLNPDWFAKHPGGMYFDNTHGTTFCII